MNRNLTKRELIVIGILAVLATVWFLATPNRASERGNMTKALSNCRQITTTLSLYAEEHGGTYPDTEVPHATTSNAVFRQLFIDGSCDNESIFGSPNSPFQPDGKIGTKPTFAEALKPGENHWAMTKGLRTSLPGDIPLVYENPAQATWPPQWRLGKHWWPARGRAWSKGEIIVGLNDGSAAVRKLEHTGEKEVSLEKLRDGKNPFELAIDPEKYPKGVVLDIEP